MKLYDYLKTSGYSIKSFGLGFIQVKKGNINYNFYTSKVDKFSNTNEPHSHQQDFISEILSGVLLEETYNLVEGNKVGYCGCGNTDLEIKGVDFNKVEKLKHIKGDLYYRLKSQYHTVQGEENTVTRVVKSGNKVDAFIIGEKCSIPLKEYNEDYLWEVVKEICENVNL